jgi:hypothetical protein
MIRSAIAMAALLGGVETHAQVDGLTMEKWCKSESINYKGTCAAYFRGLSDSSTLWQIWSDSRNQEKLHCAPEQSGDVTTRVWLKYLEENPEKLSLPAGWSYLEAMQDAYPCEEDK